MINFRFHIVSVLSVMLAVAAGLLVGGFALSGSGGAQGSNLRQSNTSLRSQVDDLQRQARSRDSFVRQVAPSLLANKLANRSVLVVSAPGVSTSAREGIEKMLAAAGAQVSGELAFTDAFFDPTRNNDEIDLAQRLLPLTVRGLPNNSNGVETASALIARVFADGKEKVDDASRTAILAGFGQLKMVTAADPTAVKPGQAVVIVTGEPYADQDAGKKNAAMLTMARQFRASFGAAVLAGTTASGDGNVLAAVRADKALAATLSTVDGVESADSQVATALAVAQQFGGKAGHYGTAKGATAPLPA
ncbi:copper transporter [Fodinicola acaciae]|uniref:copper transporter n=1 Tax=Fodinicola acaciae TaxID=2681555 RepID=UPI0013D81ACA|nr:copper transporter [Fodinicola acaciae]